MAKHDIGKRHAKRKAKQKKKRSDASRPSRDSRSAAPAPGVKEGLGWPVGDSYLSADWSVPGATVQAVLTRSHGDGRTVAAFAVVDRAGPGLTSVRVVGLPSEAALISECARLSETEDIGFAGAPAGTVAGLLQDALEHGAGRPQGVDKLLAMLEDVPVDALDTPFGAPEPTEAPPEGFLGRALRRLLG